MDILDFLLMYLSLGCLIAFFCLLVWDRLNKIIKLIVTYVLIPQFIILMAIWKLIDFLEKIGHKLYGNKKEKKRK